MPTATVPTSLPIIRSSGETQASTASISLLLRSSIVACSIQLPDRMIDMIRM
jgi:hypothetical protein